MEDEEKKKYDTYTDSQKFETMRGQVGEHVAAKLRADEEDAHRELEGIDTVEESRATAEVRLLPLVPTLPEPGQVAAVHWWERQQLSKEEEEAWLEARKPLMTLLINSEDNERVSSVQALLQKVIILHHKLTNTKDIDSDQITRLVI